MRDIEENECDAERRGARQRVGGQTNTAGARLHFLHELNDGKTT
jgi:hypothetical protein